MITKTFEGKKMHKNSKNICTKNKIKKNYNNTRKNFKKLCWEILKKRAKMQKKNIGRKFKK